MGNVSKPGMFPVAPRGTPPVSLLPAAVLGPAFVPAALFLMKTSREDFAFSGKIRSGPASAVFAAATEPSGTGEALV
jgi:hypothetical protein